MGNYPGEEVSRREPDKGVVEFCCCKSLELKALHRGTLDDREGFFPVSISSWLYYIVI